MLVTLAIAHPFLRVSLRRRGGALAQRYGSMRSNQSHINGMIDRWN
jgi:hypothetical protein